MRFPHYRELMNQYLDNPFIENFQVKKGTNCTRMKFSVSRISLILFSNTPSGLEEASMFEGPNTSSRRSESLQQKKKDHDNIGWNLPQVSKLYCIFQSKRNSYVNENMSKMSKCVEKANCTVLSSKLANTNIRVNNRSLWNLIGQIGQTGWARLRIPEWTVENEMLLVCPLNLGLKNRKMESTILGVLMSFRRNVVSVATH